MKRRQFLSGAAVAGATAAVASTFAKPAIAQEVREWRMVTTWPKNFPGLGTGANLLAEYVNKASNGRMKITVLARARLFPLLRPLTLLVTVPSKWVTAHPITGKAR